MLPTFQHKPCLLGGDNFFSRGPHGVRNGGGGEQALSFYKLGRRVTWSGVTSTSRDELVAVRFAGSGGAVFRIRATSGVAVDAFSVFSESEVTLSNVVQTLCRAMSRNVG